MITLCKKDFKRAAAWILVSICLVASLVFTRPVSAQIACEFFPVSPALTDLGSNQYSRLVSTNPLTYQPTGVIGGLYPGGSNQRPPAHEAAGVALAQQILPRDANGSPNPSGKIGMTSIGMSNTEMEFGSFLQLAHGDPQINSHLVLVNGAAGGGVIERWVDPANPFYAQTWSQLETKIAAAGLTDAQMQVAWVKVTQQSYQPNFPQDMQTFQAELETLARLLKSRFPNLKINYFSSRTRSFSYFRGLSPETSAFENGFAVRWMIEKQINGDPSLNFDPSRGAVRAAYLSWGPYLWIDGYNPRSDGRTWPLTNVDPVDCTHPTSAGQQAVAAMLMEFYKGDTTTIPWFLNPGVPTPTRSPAPTSPSPSFTPTRTLTITPTPTRTLIPTAPSTGTAAPSATRTLIFLPTTTRTFTPTSSRTATRTGTAAPTATRTRTPVATPTAPATQTPTRTPIPSPTRTRTPTPNFHSRTGFLLGFCDKSGYGRHQRLHRLRQ